MHKTVAETVGELVEPLVEALVLCVEMLKLLILRQAQEPQFQHCATAT